MFAKARSPSRVIAVTVVFFGSVFLGYGYRFVHAENFVSVGGGVLFPQNLTGVEGTENPNFPVHRSPDWCFPARP